MTIDLRATASRSGLALVMATVLACGSLQGAAPGTAGGPAERASGDANITQSDLGNGVNARPGAAENGVGTPVEQAGNDVFLVP